MFLIFCFNPLFAQNEYFNSNANNSRFEIGLLGGVNVSTFNLEKIENNNDLKMRSGFSGGILLRYVFDENFSVEPAAIYSMMGGKIYSASGDHVYKYNWINIPLIVNMTFPMHDIIRPRLFMGPELGIILDADEEVTAAGGNSISIDVKNKIKKPNFCMVFGAGIDYALGTNNLEIEFRYNVGLNDINDGFMNNKVYTRNFSVMAGYSISL